MSRSRGEAPHSGQPHSEFVPYVKNPTTSVRQAGQYRLFLDPILVSILYQDRETRLLAALRIRLTVSMSGAYCH